MFTRSAVAGLGLYVIGTWAAVGYAAYYWFGEQPAAYQAKSSEASPQPVMKAAVRISPNSALVAEINL